MAYLPDLPRPYSPCEVNCRYTSLEISSDIVISMPIILLGSPRSVACHSDSMEFFICFIIVSFDAKSNKSSTHTVIIATLSPSHRTYAHGSDIRRLYPWDLNFSSSCLFHSRPDCLSPYKVFISLQT